MKKSSVIGRKVTIKRPQDVVYNIFSDLTNLSNNLPKNVKDKVDLEVGEKTIMGKFAGFSLGLKLCQMAPYHNLIYKSMGSTPINFTISVELAPLGEEATEVQLTLNADLPGVYKMMLGNKLQEAIDQVSDHLSKI